MSVFQKRLEYRLSSVTYTQRARVKGVALQSFTVIEIGTSLKTICDFLLGFHRNYRPLPVVHRFRDVTIYWSKISRFFSPLLPTQILPEPLLTYLHGTAYCQFLIGTEHGTE